MKFQLKHLPLPSTIGVFPLKRSVPTASTVLRIFFWLISACVLVGGGDNPLRLAASAEDHWLAPTALVASTDGRTVFIACATAKRILQLDTETHEILASIATPLPPSGLALCKDGSRLLVIGSAPESLVYVVDTTQHKIIASIPAGHTAAAPVMTTNGKRLFVCNRFNNDVSVIDLQTKKETCRIAVQREPVAATLTKDGKYLLVANLLPIGRADTGTVSSVVSVIHWAARRVVKEMPLPDGGVALNDIRVAPDGKYAVATHVLARYHLPANQVERGWMNANALTIIDLAQMKILNTVLLDDVESGAANPWGIAWSTDGRKVVITHAGTHEISVIDFPALLAKLTSLPLVLSQPLGSDYGTAARVKADVPNDLTFLREVRKRVKLPGLDRGPRAVVMIGHRIYAANYFSDSLTALDVFQDVSTPESIPLGPGHRLSLARQGELYFNDASICLQGWQSCSTCHPSDARVDGLNWDLPNDGIGNPKNTKSLLRAHRMPPAMSLGVRADAPAAVRAGIQNILFTQPREEVATAIDEYLKSLKPVPSPYLVHGNLSNAAKRGEKSFFNAACADCHLPGLYTDLHPHNVGTRATYDGTADKFYTPTLIEVWRTAPYLHNGSAATIREVLTTCNQSGLHGDVSGLSHQELDDLCAYVRSL